MLDEWPGVVVAGDDRLVAVPAAAPAAAGVPGGLLPRGVCGCGCCAVPFSGGSAGAAAVAFSRCRASASFAAAATASGPANAGAEAAAPLCTSIGLLPGGRVCLQPRMFGLRNLLSFQ